MCHQREGGERKDLVEDEQGEEIAGEGHSHHRGDREGEEEVETRLILLVVTPHVADRIGRGHDPEERGDEGEENAQRLGLERDRDSGDRLRQHHLRARAAAHRNVDPQDDREEDPGGDQTGRLAQVRIATQQQDERGPGDRHHQREDEERGHGAIPAISTSAACRAIPAVRPALIPKYRFSTTSAHVGHSKVHGASRICSSPGNSRKYATSTTRQM